MGSSDPASPFQQAARALRRGTLVWATSRAGRPGDKKARDIQAQTELALGHLREVLRSQGAALSHLVSLTLYLADWTLVGGMNSVYARFFPSSPPARTTVQVELWPPGSLLGISAWAWRGDPPARPLSPPHWKPPISPYSWGMLAGPFLFAAGMVGEDPVSSALLDVPPGEQAVQARRNLRSLLHEAGLAEGTALFRRIFLRRLEDAPQVATALGGRRPGDLFIGAPLVSPLLQVEMQTLVARRARPFPLDSCPVKELVAWQAEGLVFLTGSLPGEDFSCDSLSRFLFWLEEAGLRLLHTEWFLTPAQDPGFLQRRLEERLPHPFPLLTLLRAPLPAGQAAHFNLVAESRQEPA